MAIRLILKNDKKLYEAYVNGFDSAGRRIQRKKTGLLTLKQAQAAEFELKRDLAKRKEEAVPYRWDEWLAECLRRMKVVNRPSTVINYETRLAKWITPRWRNLELSAITKLEIHETVFEHLGNEMTEHSRRSVFKMIRRVLEMAVEDGHLTRNPCNGIRVKVAEVAQKVLTNDEVSILLREAKAADHPFYPVWAFALMTGMRSGEMHALKWTDIDLDGRLVSITKQWTSKNGICSTKTHQNRVVPISDELLKFLKERKLQSAESEFVLPRLIEWDRGEQARVIRDFCETIGITSVKFHDLRATFITNLLSRGESLARVMAVVGHTEIKTTNSYLRRAGVELRGATDKLGYKLPEGPMGARILPFTRSKGPVS